MKISGKWNRSIVEDYLLNTNYPIRLSFISPNEFPLVTSLWYLYIDGKFWCAVQKNSIVARNLVRNSKCGFEIGSNKPPYKGVRGQGDAILYPEHGKEKLLMLIDKYLDNKNSGLKDWLISRSDNEVAICIEPICFYSWDYSYRMK